MAQPEYLAMNPGEQVIVEAHRHWINVLPFFVSTAIVIVAGFLAIGYVGANPDAASKLFPGLSIGIITPVVALLDIVAIITLFFAYTVYRQNKIILTNMHFIQITQTGLFGRTLSKLSLDELQDVRGSRKGVFGTILNYGEILIETAGNEENFFFRPVSDPLNVAEKINDTHEYYEREYHVQSGIDNAVPRPPIPEAPQPDQR
jgi:uncharacterized membrane protein YdbT with pleckstrin-like domain